MKRLEFISLLGGRLRGRSRASAQQAERVRTIALRNLFSCTVGR
jgi:hypothetical protein